MATNCRSCSTALPDLARFCPQCGSDQLKPHAAPLRLSMRGVLLIGVVGALLWAGSWYCARALAGVKPTGSETELTPPTPDSGELAALREAAKKNPDSLDGWKALASALFAKLEQEKNPSSEAVFDLIDALSQVLRIDPKDKDALIAMADISFERQVYDKAGDYYKRFLVESPDDPAIRSRYASTLAYSGKLKEAKVELEAVLKKTPDHFPSLAYLTVALAQLGERQKSIEIGERAVKAAPEGEARAQLSSFLERVKRGEDISAPHANPRDDASSQMSAEATTFERELGKKLSSSPIAGPKFVRVERESAQVVKALFKDFPMQSMPPFAKQKFFGSLEPLFKTPSGKDVAKIQFVDAATGQVLDELARPK